MVGHLPLAQRWLLAFVLLGIPLSAWGAVYPPNTWLQVGPVAILLLIAVPALQRWPLSMPSIACICGFLAIHLFAARWTYSDVPYDVWTQTAFGFSINHAFGFSRNMFDRLVHFSFGLLMVAPAIEFHFRHLNEPRRRSLYAAFMFVCGTSALYEIFEWLLAVFMDPAAAEAYNGQQGDVFDSSKDMAMAALGAVLAIPISGTRHLKKG